MHCRKHWQCLRFVATTSAMGSEDGPSCLLGCRQSPLSPAWKLQHSGCLQATRRPQRKKQMAMKNEYDDMQQAALATTVICQTIQDPQPVLKELLQGPIKQHSACLQELQKTVMRELPRNQASSSALSFMADWCVPSVAQHVQSIICNYQLEWACRSCLFLGIWANDYVSDCLGTVFCVASRRRYQSMVSDADHQTVCLP